MAWQKGQSGNPLSLHGMPVIFDDFAGDKVYFITREAVDLLLGRYPEHVARVLWQDEAKKCGVLINVDSHGRS